MRKLWSERLKEQKYKEEYGKALDTKKQNEMKSLMSSKCGRGRQALIYSAREMVRGV